MNKFPLNRLIRYFLRGLIFVVPLTLTVYIIYEIIEWLDGLIPIKVPGLGLLIIVCAITILGYLASFFITRPIFDQFEKYFTKIPLVSILYSSIKDLIGAFVGDKKRFNVPVTVALDDSGTILKIGFITCDDLEEIGLPGYVSVYLPHSYNFSGNHFLVEKSKVKTCKMRSTAAMKFVVSGGVSGLKDSEQEK
ncbi:DUF502 domain-containing protein [Fulvivirga sp. M361]|uniref:DUF502 domain-containing protein n=1 Tax=Fulvivirga sp. M361 TaxID=2594266 RepID=UPI00117AB14E|nr:DUF502 domain-containing protein [Fulvivirga sp. M361]TRX52011.1 DUF502 domain-containing protein [Fulvivirga sp. M361]